MKSKPRFVPMTDPFHGSKLHPFLRGLRPEWLALVAECSVHSNFRSGKSLFQQGDSSNRIHLVLRGHVGLEILLDDSPHQIGTEGPGGLLGTFCMKRQCYWGYSARAVGTVETQSILTRRLMNVCKDHPPLLCEIAQRMMKVFSEQLDATRLQLAETSRLALESQFTALRALGPIRNSFPAL